MEAEVLTDVKEKLTKDECREVVNALPVSENTVRNKKSPGINRRIV